MSLPKYRLLYDQGVEGACVGFSSSWMMSILNRRLYNARKLYQEAQLVDEWSDTPPEEGTSVRAAMDVLRGRGHWRIFRSLFEERPTLEDGIKENRWAQTADEVRTAIAFGVPVVLGVNWYAEFSKPQLLPPPSGTDARDHKEWWIGRSADWGRIAGGHAICAYRMSDKRQAIGLINTWGMAYPKVWIPYDAVERLIREDGEAALVTDRIA